jgi:ribonuclease HII
MTGPGDGADADDGPRIGSDEAGKGPVLGPMVAAAVRARPGVVPDGVDDSKRLSAERRASIAATLRDRAAVAIGVAVVPTDRIDDPGTDMNSLTVAAHVEAVAGVARPDDRAVADAGDVDAARFGRRVAEGVAADGPVVGVHAEHGADAADPLVAAASVVAKVERDARMEAIDAAYPEHGPVGSGYPGDPETRAFLRRYVGATGALPDCARASWSTADDVLAAAEQSSLSEF